MGAGIERALVACPYSLLQAFGAASSCGAMRSAITCICSSKSPNPSATKSQMRYAIPASRYPWSAAATSSAVPATWASGCALSPMRMRRSAGSNGMRSLREDGWMKVAQGVTSADEVLRVTQEF